MTYKYTTIIFAIAFIVSLGAFLLADNRANKNMQMLIDLSDAVKNSNCMINK